MKAVRAVRAVKVVKGASCVLLVCACGLAILFAESCSSISKKGLPKAATATEKSLERDSALDLVEARGLVKRYYVYAPAFNADTCATWRSLLQGLDPHSFYCSKSWLKGFEKIMQPQQFGMGFELYAADSMHCRVWDVQAGSAAWRAGLAVNDEIRVVNRTSCRRLKADSVMKLVQKYSEYLALLVRRETATDTLYLCVNIRENWLPEPHVSPGLLLCDSIGYLQLRTFSSGCAAQVHAELQRLVNAGMKKLILDLRDNQGGYENEALDILDEFLPDSLLMLSEKGRGVRASRAFFCANLDSGIAEWHYDVRAHKKGLFEHQPIVVLMNHQSASASEIVAGSLQQNRRAVLMGESSYGKGRIQRHYMLPSGAELSLTIGEFVLPNSVRVDAFLRHDSTGLQPDVQLSSAYEATLDQAILERIRREVRDVSPDLQEARAHAAQEYFMPDALCAYYSSPLYRDYVWQWSCYVWADNCMNSWVLESRWVNKAVEWLRHEPLRDLRAAK